MAHSSLTTLGAFVFRVNGVAAPPPSTRKARALMAYLVMHRETDIARERLVEIFWPNADPDNARYSFNTALWSIRRCVKRSGIDPNAAILAKKATIRWVADTQTDVEQFTELANRNDDSTSREALALYRGEFLEGDYDTWTIAQRERLASRYEALLARVVKASGDADAARQLIERNPYDEDAYVAVIDAELTDRRRSSAAAWVKRCREALLEVGEQPSAAFESRFGDLVQTEPLLQDEISLPFAGRDAELALLAAKIQNAATGRGSVTLVHGEAGIGKSILLDQLNQMATRSGCRVIRVQCASTLSPFGPWQDVFRDVEAGDFETFVKVVGRAVPPAIADAIDDRLNTPTVIIVDDAHKLNGDALEIFVCLALLASRRHAVVVGLRPEGLRDVRARIETANLEEISLGPLGREHLRTALSRTLGGEQPEVLDVLYDRSGGHPLFFEGLLNSLIHAGALARGGSSWQLVRRIDREIELPDTVKR